VGTGLGAETGLGRLAGGGAGGWGAVMTDTSGGGGLGMGLMAASLPAGVRNGTYTRPVAGL